ncbi:hypothetical protein DL766_003692 [Monosporascus sp. MC13-8B]|uniref:RBR-type E3 ubiquitin transferase n=1 Tax=Monosporascus cannonballus TaxID=155416 RepID=A0ABY0GYM6_9PEZI|nr:hypothetical protein DL762_007598 [Monosporascus cannonballus]RYO82131.1 hypothetical protein DL763_008327 [Monosporascus cannonballus]RYP32968.1 hypothetical protein DL766_003692 [Monosporascus sp. MC13-8B]
MIAWHDEYTCDEYDGFLTDPLNFRSQAQLAGEAAEARDRAMDDLQRQIEDSERQFNYEILASRQRTEALRLSELARIEGERQEALERARREEAQRQAEEKRKVEARKKAEEEATQVAFTNRTFSNPVKPCPKCKRPIEKRGGCNHMHCPLCNINFDWGPLFF